MVFGLIRYPGDIAEGTAVPYWAYFNVTVSVILKSSATFVLTSNMKTLPDELWNDTTARRVGREFGLE